jgi:hypothetical protein
MPRVGFEPPDPGFRASEDSVCLRPLGYRDRTERIRSIEKSDDFIETRTRYLSACSIVPQPATLPRAPIIIIICIYSVPCILFLFFIRHNRNCWPLSS